jgi:leucyl/phenylalanyl-tRNA--protein transferase
VADFTLDDLIDCYTRGLFPMAETREGSTVYLVDPDLRGVLPLDGFNITSRLARTVRSDRFEVRVDTAFDRVIAACAEPRADGGETWINAEIEAMYVALFARGQAHSVECWQDGALVGGLYGVCLGGAFFGESMFSVARDASKVALTHLVARLSAGGFALLDAQFLTDHLARFGAVAIARSEYQALLVDALEIAGDFFALPRATTGAQALQAISQAS